MEVFLENWSLNSDAKFEMKNKNKNIKRKQKIGFESLLYP